LLAFNFSALAVEVKAWIKANFDKFSLPLYSTKVKLGNEALKYVKITTEQRKRKIQKELKVLFCS